MEKHGNLESELSERLHRASSEKKAELAKQARKLTAQGFCVNRIAKEIGISWNIVNLSLFAPVNYERKDP
jgi:uncharacterized protein (UPF0210 family)